MFSRLTAFAAAFSILATASLAVAAQAHQNAMTAQISVKPMRVIQLETVVIVAKRASN